MILILIITFTLTTISTILTTFWSYAKHHHEHTETNIKPNFLNNISLLFNELINPILISLCFLCFFIQHLPVLFYTSNDTHANLNETLDFQLHVLVIN